MKLLISVSADPRVQSIRKQLRGFRKTLNDLALHSKQVRKGLRKQRKALRAQQKQTAGGKLQVARLESRISLISLKEKQIAVDFNKKKATIIGRLVSLQKQLRDAIKASTKL
jgi:hypothetical protein